MQGSIGGTSNSVTRAASDAARSGVSPIQSDMTPRMKHLEACHSRAAANRAWRSVEASCRASGCGPTRNLRFVTHPSASRRRSGHTKRLKSHSRSRRIATIRRAHASARREIRRCRSGGTTMMGSGTNAASIRSGEREVGRSAISRRRTGKRFERIRAVWQFWRNYRYPYAVVGLSGAPSRPARLPLPRSR